MSGLAELVGLKMLSLRRRPPSVQNGMRALVPELARNAAAYAYAAQLLIRAQIITFDFHGVIINDEAFSQQATFEVFAKHGLPIWPAHYDAYFLGKPDRETFVDYFQRPMPGRPAKAQVPIEQLVQEKLGRYLGLLEEQSSKGQLFFDGAKELIHLLSRSGSGKSLGVVSTVQPERLAKGLELLGVANVFKDKTVDLSAVGRGKPSPEAHLKMLEMHGFSDKALKVVIEDTPAGVMAAKRAKMFCIAVMHTSSYDELRRAGADVIVPNLRGLYSAVRLMA